MQMIEYARYAASCGLCVLPPREDGTKAPFEPWKQYQFNMPSEEKLIQWFDVKKLSGIGFVTGAVSGNLEVMDFDIADAWPRFVDAMNGGDPDLMELLQCGLVETTPKGVHLYYRCKQIDKSQKLAMENGRVMIETRGGGGYIIAAPSGAKVNPAGCYKIIAGSLANIPSITPEQRNFLHRVASEVFDESVRKHSHVSTHTATDKVSGGRPGDDFNSRHTVQEVIIKYGWTHVANRGDVEHWRKPDSKKRGHHATVNHDGTGKFYVFSTDAAPFEAITSYSAFSCYALLEHGGDYERAASDLAARGYGTHADRAVEDVPWMNERKKYDGLIYDFTALEHKDLPEPKMLTQFLPEGLSVLAGAPKIGKSWFCLGLCAAAVSGGKMQVFEHFKIEPVKCLYLALEDGERRIKKRSQTVMKPPLQFDRHVKAQYGWFRLAHSWPKMTAGGLQLLDDYLTDNDGCKIVIIDTLAKIKAGGSRSKNAYENDYDIISEIKKIADKFHAAIILITHLNKSHGDYNDILEEITGSMGISGAADTIMVLKRPRGKENSADAEFHVTGRDIEEQTYSLKFSEGIWYHQGDLTTFSATKKQNHVLAALQDIGRPAWPREIGKWIEENHGETIASLKRMLPDMVEDALLVKTENGYALPPR